MQSFSAPLSLGEPYGFTRNDPFDRSKPVELVLPQLMLFVGPYDSCRLYEQHGIPEPACRLIHPGQTIEVRDIAVCATFALPTDKTDLNHTGMLLTFSSGISFFNSGYTARAEHLRSLLPDRVDICAVCINGGYHNLPPEHAALIVKAVNARVAIPCHYDLMVNNVGSPEMFRVALERSGSSAEFQMLRYYEPWLYMRNTTGTQSERRGQ